MTHDALELRLRRLERTNRLLIAVLLVLVVTGLAGWRAQGSVVRANRIEIVDARDVPIISLGSARGGTGGEIILRAENGEKRVWITTENDGASLTLNREGQNGKNDTTLGLSISPKSGQLNILSPGGASLSANIQNDEPKVELFDRKGTSLFVAPWKN